MSIYDPPLHTLDGDPTSLGDYRGKALLVVNVASKCGLTPQYEGLERLQKTYGDKGFTVLGFPCNQFGEQEPGHVRGDRHLLLGHLRGDLPDDREGGGERRRSPPGLRGADGVPRRRGRGGRHPVELREVPGLAGRARSSSGSGPWWTPRPPRSSTPSRPTCRADVRPVGRPGRLRPPDRPRKEESMSGPSGRATSRSSTSSPRSGPRSSSPASSSTTSSGTGPPTVRAGRSRTRSPT